MLILTRTSGQRIMIDDNIEVIVLESRGNRVRLGFIAPADIPIQRRELLHASDSPVAPAVDEASVGCVVR